jgi:hypothetical protein
MSNISRRDFIIAGTAGAIAAGAVGCKDTPKVTDTPPSVRLSVLMTGLIGMVSNNGGTDFVLVDGDATLNIPHYARLLAPTGTISTGGIPPTGNHKDGRPFWDLKNHLMTLTSGVNTGTTKVCGLRGPGEDVPSSPNKHRDVSWLAQMAKIPGAASGRIKTECLAADPPASAKVASRVRFNGGEIAARFKPPYHQVVFQIGTANPFKQALGEVTYSQTIESGDVRFQLRRFGTTEQNNIVLAPSTGVKLELEITNAPEPIDCKNPSQVNNLHHFVAFYELLDPAATDKPIPACQSNCPGCPSEPEVVYCPPAEYQM